MSFPTLLLLVMTNRSLYNFLISFPFYSKSTKIEEGSRIWIQTHKNEGFDYKLEQPFNLKLLGDAEKIWHYRCHSLRERWG
jgi:hypothetical protein